MSTWYETKRFSNLITTVEADRETDLSIYINGHRNAKISQWTRYFPTWEEAHAYLLDRAENRLTDARRHLEHAQGELGNVKGLKKP